MSDNATIPSRRSPDKYRRNYTPGIHADAYSLRSPASRAGLCLANLKSRPEERRRKIGSDGIPVGETVSVSNRLTAQLDIGNAAGSLERCSSSLYTRPRPKSYDTEERDYPCSVNPTPTRVGALLRRMFRPEADLARQL